ncbi:MAG: hypothetical protein WAT74_13165 [Flavobacteriales bacterium]
MPFTVEINEPNPSEEFVATVAIEEDGFVRDVQVVNSDKRVHVLFYKEDSSGKKKEEDKWSLKAFAQTEGTERYMHVLVFVGNELMADSRRLIKDGKK